MTTERDECPECARSNGPHYTGPCQHGQTIKAGALPFRKAAAIIEAARDVAGAAGAYGRTIAERDLRAALDAAGIAWRPDAASTPLSRLAIAAAAEQTIRQTIDDPCTSFWLAGALVGWSTTTSADPERNAARRAASALGALYRDALDAARDAETLATLLRARCDALLPFGDTEADARDRLSLRDANRRHNALRCDEESE